MLYEAYRNLTGEELERFPLPDRLEKANAAGLIYWPLKKDGIPRISAELRQYTSKVGLNSGTSAMEQYQCISTAVNFIIHF